jgi:hypothetical protein
MVIIIERFGERVKRVWQRIYDLERKPRQTKLSNWRDQKDSRQ